MKALKGPLKHVWFYPVFYLFEERSALKRVVIKVVFSGVPLFLNITLFLVFFIDICKIFVVILFALL